MKSSSDLTDKVVVITGGAGLIGRGFSAAVAGHGARVIVADIDPDKGKDVCESIAAQSTRGAVEFAEIDINSAVSSGELIGSVTARHGRIDALVNNARPFNAQYGCDFEDVTYESFCDNVNLHLGGYFLMTQQVAKVMMAQKHGVIVNIASIYGFIAPRFELYENADFTSPVEYYAIKGALLSLTKYLASYLGQHNIRVNALSPGGVFNQQAESFVERYAKKTLIGGDMAQLDDLTGALVFLLSDASKYMTGQNVVVDGGWSI